MHWLIINQKELSHERSSFINSMLIFMWGDISLKIKKIKKIKVNSFDFSITWDKSHSGGWFNYGTQEINIGLKGNSNDLLFMIICHELMEICACEVNVRMQRPDCETDYIFVYDHRQHETMMNMFAGLISKFVG